MRIFLVVVSRRATRGAMASEREDLTEEAQSSSYERGSESEVEDVDKEEEEEEEETSSSFWESVLLFSVAFLVIQTQVVFVSCVFNLILRQFILPKGIAFQRPFYPDYQQTHPVAYVPMLEDKYLTSGQIMQEPLGSRLLIRDGSYFDVWLRMSLPYSEENQALFQVQVDLLALNSSVVFSDKRTCLMRRQNAVLRYVKLAALAPLYLLGWLEEGKETLYFPVVQGFKQGNIENVGEAKVSQLKVSILSQENKRPPEIYEAEAHLLVKLNMVQHFMYHYPFTSFVVFSIALAVALNSLMLAILVLVFVVLLFASSDEIEDGDEEEGEEETSHSDKEGEADEIVDVDGATTEASELSSGMNLDFHSDSGKGKESQPVSENDSQLTPWEPTTTTPSDASVDNTSNGETRIVKAGSKKYITETRQRKT